MVHKCAVTVIINKAASAIFLYKKTVLNVLNLHELICKQLINFFKYVLIRKITICRHDDYYLVKSRGKNSLLFRKNRKFSNVCHH